MNISIDKAIEWQLDMNCAAIYVCILKRDHESFDKLKTIMSKEWFGKYINKLGSMNLIVMDKVAVNDVKLDNLAAVKPKRVSKKNVDPLSFDAFVLEYYNCFPEGVFTGDYKVKSGLSQCKNKLKTFMNTHKNYTKELVIRATKQYVENKKRENYTFMKIAPYFIAKEGQPSLLESMCESLLKGECLKVKNMGNTESI